MNTTGNTVLITGGGTGVGLALAAAFLKTGNEVIICGRRQSKLDGAKRRFPKLDAIRCDISDARERSELLRWATRNFPGLNVLVNNAGIQRQIDLRKGTRDLLAGEDEIEVNLRAPIHLSASFIPHLMKQSEAAIVNISSGLAFIPLAAVPVYGATKAAIHSFSLSLRHQLKETGIKVFEIVPPMVDTELHQGQRGRRGDRDKGIKPEEVAVATLRALETDEYEIAVGRAESLRMGARNDPEQFFRMMNG